jgi:hypothetical protein
VIDLGLYKNFGVFLFLREGGLWQNNKSAMWQFYENSMQRHILMHMATTYFNIGGVEKIGYCTWKQTLNQTPLAECIVVINGSCGS